MKRIEGNDWKISDATEIRGLRDGRKPMQRRPRLRLKRPGLYLRRESRLQLDVAIYEGNLSDAVKIKPKNS